MANAFAIFCGLVCLTGSLVPILAFNPADLGPKRKAVEKREKLILFLRKRRVENENCDSVVAQGGLPRSK